jgi:hypothetical protein
VAALVPSPRRHPNARAVLGVASGLLMIGLGLAACEPTKPAADMRPGGSLTGARVTTSSQLPSQPASPTTVPSRPKPRTSQPTPVMATGGDRITAAGAILPNRDRTPGAINPSVTAASIGRTICISGWTQTIRPSSAYTTSLKAQQLASGYAYHGDTNRSDYEEDHLISLELGGSTTSPRNLWPEPYTATDGARTKDKIENKLHTLVCAGTLSLATAQRAIAANWYTAYLTYIGAPAASTPTTHPATSPPPVVPGNGATALCNDGTYSYAAHHQGACSHHGGVKVFYK